MSMLRLVPQIPRALTNPIKSHHTTRAQIRDKKAMEVEVKLTLPDASAHGRLSELLTPYHKVTHLQENYFFDGPNSELGSRKAVLRLRFYNENRCVVTFKTAAVILNGVSTAHETEDDIDATVGRECVADPHRLESLDNPIMQRLKQEFNCWDFVGFGGFRNIRNVYEWEGETLELDETQYPFGTAYEIECETPDPERVAPMLEAFLRENGIPFSHSVFSKFAVFRAGKLPGV